MDTEEDETGNPDLTNSMAKDDINTAIEHSQLVLFTLRCEGARCSLLT